MLFHGNVKLQNMIWKGKNHIFPIGLQMHSKKVLNLLKNPESSFLESIWSPTVSVKTAHETALLCSQNAFEQR